MSLAKGTTYMLVAQFIFMAGGYAVHFGLGRMLGPEQYGIYGVMLSLITLSTILLTSGIPPAISKYVSEGNDPQAVRAAAMKNHLASLQALKLSPSMNGRGLTLNIIPPII